MPSLHRLVAPSFCVLLAGDAFAQSPGPSPSPSPSSHPRFETAVDVEGDPRALPETNVTAMKIGAPLQKTPASVAVVPAALVEDQGGAILQDALKNVSGVTVGTFTGIFDQFVVRGFDSVSSGLVLVDAAGEATLYPLYNVQRLEVLKGPAAFVYGGSPLSSAVHLVRKQPQESRFGNLDLSLGSFGTWDAGADLNTASRDGRAAFRLNAYGRNTDGWRDGRDSKIYAVNPAFRFIPSSSTRVDLNLEYLRSEANPDAGVPVSSFLAVPAVPRERSYQSPLDTSKQSLLRLRLDADWRISTVTTLHGKLYFTDLDWDSTATLLTGITPLPTNLLVNRNLAILDDRQKLFGNQLETASSFTALGAEHRLLIGFENSRLTDRYRQHAGFLPTIDLLNPVETARPPAQIIPGFSAAADAKAWVRAPYVVDLAAVSNKLQLFAGARLDFLDYEDPATATYRDATRLSPSGGVVLTPRPEVSFYLSASSAFAPPSSTVAGPRDPETSRQYEVGAKASLAGGKAQASAAVYDLRRRNIAIPDAAGLLRQSGDQRSRGFEVDVRAETGPLSVLAGYAFTDATLERFAERVVVGFDPTTFRPVFATLDRSGNTSPFAPRHLVNGWASRRFDAFEVGLGVRLVGEQFIAEDNARTLETYGLLDAMAAYRFGRARLVVNLHNLTDKEYFTRGFGNTSVIPGAPFAAYARLEVGLGSRRGRSGE